MFNLEDFQGTSDMQARVRVARLYSPKDPITRLAVLIVKSVTAVVGIALLPVQFVTTAATGCLIAVTFGGASIVFSIVWWPMIVLLLATSWLWIKAWYLRPLLLPPGVALAIVASAFAPLIGEFGETGSRYTKLSLSQEWPLTWYLLRPPESS